MFIGALVVASMVVAALGSAAMEVADGMGLHGKNLAKGLKSDMVLINDPENVATSPLTIYAKNTGSVALFAEETELLLDGVVATSVTYDVLASADDAVWRPGEVLKMTTSEFTVGAGDHAVKVVAESGVEATFTFHV